MDDMVGIFLLRSGIAIRLPAVGRLRVLHLLLCAFDLADKQFGADSQMRRIDVVVVCHNRLDRYRIAARNRIERLALRHRVCYEFAPLALGGLDNLARLCRRIVARQFDCLTRFQSLFQHGIVGDYIVDAHAVAFGEGVERFTLGNDVQTVLSALNRDGLLLPRVCALRLCNTAVGKERQQQKRACMFEPIHHLFPLKLRNFISVITFLVY